jgi:hypothetical protein
MGGQTMQNLDDVAAEHDERPSSARLFYAQHKLQLFSILVLVVFYAVYFLPAILLARSPFMPTAGDQPVGYFPLQVGLSEFSAWGVWNFGGVQTVSPILLLWLIVQALVSSPVLTQVLIYFGLFVVGSVGFLLMLWNLKVCRIPWIVVPMSIAYMFNWVAFQSDATRFLAILAGGPLILLGTISLLRGRSAFGNGMMVVLGLSISSLPFNVVGLSFGVIFILVGVVASVLGTDSRLGVIAVARRLPFLIAFLFLSVILNLPFFYVPITLDLRLGLSGYIAAASTVVGASPLTELSNMGVFAPLNISPFVIAAGPSPTYNPFWLAGISVPALAAVGILSRQKEHRALAITCAIVVSLLYGLVELIVHQSQLVNTLFYHLPFLYLFISPLNIMVVLAAALFVLAGLGAGQLATAVNHRDRTRIIGVAMLFVVVSSIAISSMSSTGVPQSSFYSQYTGNYYDDGVAQPKELPTYFENLLNMFSKEQVANGPFRVLWLPDPIYYSEALSMTPDRLVFSAVSNPTLRNELINATSDLYSSNATNVGQVLAPFGFKFVLALKDVNESVSGFQICATCGNTPISLEGSGDYFYGQLIKQSDLKLVSNTTDFALFENLAIPASSYGVFWGEPEESISLTNSSAMLLPEAYAQVNLVSSYPPFSPSEYNLSVTSQGPTWLIFDESYDPSWQLVSNGVKAPHIEVMGWANAFLIPGQGTRQVYLSFAPQIDLTISYFVSASTLIALVCIWGYRRRKGKFFRGDTSVESFRQTEEPEIAC